MKEKLKLIKEKMRKLYIKLHLNQRKNQIALGILLALIVGAVVCIIVFGHEKIPKGAQVIVDANSKSSVKEAGFVVDKKDRKRTRYSAKWSVDEVANFEVKNYAKDISKHDTLHFRMKLEAEKEARIMFYFGSENKKTEEADFYSYTITAKPGEWVDYEVKLSRLAAYGTPLGLDKLTEISIRTTGWRNHAEEGSVVRFGHIYLTGEPAKLKPVNLSGDASLYPHFTQLAIDEAAECAAKPVGWPQYDNGSGLDAAPNSYPGEKCTNALYYLALAVYYNEMDEQADPLYASNGMLCKDAVIELLEFFLQGGNEPMASPGCFWGHGVMSSALLLIKNTEAIYDELSQETKDKMDWMMRALAVAANWGYNSANDYTSGLDLHGNFNKTWNMNFQNSYLTVMVNASMYFGNAELNQMFVDFDYDTYMDKFREYKFINVIYAWETAGKTLMETGVCADGEDPRTVAAYGGNTTGGAGDTAGSGKGVKIPFVFDNPLNKTKISLKDEDFAIKMFSYQIAATYSKTVKSENGKSGDEDHCFILGDVTGEEENKETGEIEKLYTVRTSPFEGRIGMFSELAANDSHGKRSCLVYPYDSFEILTSLYANMKLFGGWDSSTEDMQALDEQIYVGNEDFLFRGEYGHRGYASGRSTTEYEYTFEYRGIFFVKDIWKNFHCDWDGDVSVKQDRDAPEIVDLPDAEPLGGAVTGPAGTLNAVRISNNAFPDAAYTSIGKLSKGNIKFDIVVGNDVLSDENVTYDSVVAFLRRGSGSRGYNDTVMSIQMQGQLVNFRSGSSYARTGFQFESNYRFHVELDFDAVARKYTATVYQIYPTEGEVYTCEDIPFRVGGDLNTYIDSIAVIKANDTSDMWVENLYVNDKLVQGTNAQYSDKIVKVEDTDAPNTKLRVNTKIWNEFTDYTKTRELYHVNKETVVITATDRASELKSLQYCVTSKPLSESAVKSYSQWTTAEHGVACFKLEPYKQYYVYVKAVDTEGNVGYVSNYIMLDPDLPSLKGVTSGKTYCEGQTIVVSDRYLTSFQINGEELIGKLPANGQYVLQKNIGKVRIVLKDRAGNQRKVTVRLSDTALKDKIMLDKKNPTKEQIQAMGWNVDTNNTFNGLPYSAKWRVDNTYKNISGPTGDLEDYTKLHFAIKVVPKNKVSSVNFIAYFRSANDPNGKMQYFPAELTVKANTWTEITLDFSALEENKTRYPEWAKIENFRLQANGWGDDSATIEQGGSIYIGYMYMTAGKESRVHAKEPTYEYVPSATNSAKHDYKYTCCDTVVRSEPHVKSANSDLCSICGHDMNATVKVQVGDREWNQLSTSAGDTYYTSEKRFTISATDNGFGVKKLEYAVSDTFVADSGALKALKWTSISNPYNYNFTKENSEIFVYARVTDNNGKVTYISTDGMVYDKTLPTLTGVTNGTTYCEPPTITVKDTNLKQVTVGGKKVALDSDGKYTLGENCGTKVIVATDKAGNSVTKTVTVSDKLLADKVVSSSASWKTEGTEKQFKFVKEEETKGIDISAYKKLTMRIKVSTASGTKPTAVRVQARLWSHTYYEWVVPITANQWTTVSVNLHEPQNIGRSMTLSNVRQIVIISRGGDADVAEGSMIAIQNLCLKEERVHANPIQEAYAVDSSNNKQHIIRYECCDYVIRKEAHTYGSDGKCVYCTAPTLKGITNGKTYCNPPTITVTDNNKLAYVKVNGSNITLNSKNQYTLPNKNGTYTIEIMDEYANKTKATVKILNVSLENTKTIIPGFTYDFAGASRKYINKTVDSLGEILASYDTLKFSMNVTSNQIPKGTKVPLWVRMYIDNNNYYMYRTDVTVGQSNNVTFKLANYESTTNKTSGYKLDMADIQSIWFQGDWSKSNLQYCAIEVSALTVEGLHRERVHTYDQFIENDTYRVNPNEQATCAKGISYYKSCICGTKGTETFEGAKNPEHASNEFIYQVNAENNKQHDKIHKCCGQLEAVEAHYNTSITVAGNTTCEACGATYFDYMDKTAPSITGIEDGRTYFNVMPTMVVTDDWLDKVTVNGKTVTINKDSTPYRAEYKFAVSEKPYTVVATDYSGNEVTYTISVHSKTVYMESACDTLTGWTKAAAYQYGSSQYTEKAGKVSIENYNGENVMRFYDTGYRYYRAIKSISTEDMETLTVEFDVLSPKGGKAEFGLMDLVPEGSPTGNIGTGKCLWSGTPTEWTRVKVEFTFGVNGVTATTYTKPVSNPDAVYEAVTAYRNVPIDAAYTNNNNINVSFYSSLSAKTPIYFDNIAMYEITNDPIEEETAELVKSPIFATDFATAGNAATLVTDGWNQASAWRYSSSKFNEDASRVLKSDGSLKFYSKNNNAYHRVVKNIDKTGLTNLTVEFDVKAEATSARVKFGLVNLNGTSENDKYKVGEELWYAGSGKQGNAPLTWTRVKIVFAIDGDNITTTAYTKAQGADDTAYVAVTGYAPCTVSDAYASLDTLGLCIYSEHGGSGKTTVNVDNVDIYTMVEGTGEPAPEPEYEKAGIFTTDFATAGNAATLVTDGWNQASAWRYSSSKFNEDASRVLKSDGSLKFYSKNNNAYHRVVKNIDKTGLTNLTVEFDVKAEATSARVKFGLVNLNGTSENDKYKVGEELWYAGSGNTGNAPLTWTRVKIVFAIDGDNITATAYTKAQGADDSAYQAVAGYESRVINTTYASLDTLGLCIYSEHGGSGKTTVNIDNVEVYKLVPKTN